MAPRFARKLAGGDFPLSLEITPPRVARAPVLLRRAGLLGARADAVDLVQRPDRQPSLEAALELREAGIDGIWHLASRGRGRAELEREIAAAARAGLALVLCVRGDSGGADRPDTPKLRELIAELRRNLSGALVGATVNQYAPRERALANLLAKLDAGADFVQTQPVLRRDAFQSFADALRARRPDARIVPMATPVLSASAAQSLGKRLGLPLPKELLERLARGGEDEGWEIFAQTLRWLSQRGRCDGLVLMTLAMDPAPAYGERLREVVDRELA